MSFTRYEEAVDWITGLVPFGIRPGLARVEAMLAKLGHPERRLKFIHVAGTNGKGSTCAYLASVLQQCGYDTGSFTSPYISRFTDRIRMNGQDMPDDILVEIANRLKPLVEEVAASELGSPTMFEVTTVLAIVYFAKYAYPDVVVMETGLGGLLDSTNVIVPIVSVITNVGTDHTDILGESIEQIAGQKAGIIKPGVPVVIGEADDETGPVFAQRAATMGAPITVVDPHAPLTHPIGLMGPHQEQNARTALATIEQLRTRGWTIPEAAVRDGLAHVVTNTGLRGRWETIGQQPLTIADVGHNPDGLRIVRHMLARTPHHRLHVVLGMVHDKDIASALTLLPPEATYYFCKADIPRGMDAAQLCELALSAGLHGAAHPSVAAAVEAAREAAGPDDLVLVTGSVFVVAEAL